MAARTKSQKKALKFLEAQIRSSEYVREDRITFQDLIDLVISDYETRGLRSKYDLRVSRLPHLNDFFANRRAVDITPDVIRRYVSERRREGAAPSSINREIGVLRRGFRLAVQDGRLTTAPYNQLLRESNIRQGFVSNDQFEAICGRLEPSDYVDVARFLYLTGWRVSEALSLEWRDVDFDEGTIRLRSENSKTLGTRRIRMGAQLRELLVHRLELRRVSTRLIFHRDGHRIPRGVISRSWRHAAAAADCAGIILHDLRRTAARNLVRAGASERVAIVFLGHRTRSTFDRYNIVSDDDVLAAQDKLGDYLTEQAQASNVRKLERG